MKTLAIALLAGAAALSTGSAKASDIYVSEGYANPDLVQQVRLVCDEYGNCYRSRGGARVVVRDSYNYAPRERYYSSTIALGKQLGLSVIAEGIENRATADLLIAMGCEEGQGYFFGKPMPVFRARAAIPHRETNA